jgi:hypothetical protein
MRDMPKILLGLAIFVILAAFPIWYNLASPDMAGAPELVILTADIPGKTECVLPSEEMRTAHMDLLMEWRNDVVRLQDRYHTDEHGRTFEKSLTNTCLDCHSNKDNFCDRCHSYMEVSPYCWDCHIIPQDLDVGGAE